MTLEISSHARVPGGQLRARRDPDWMLRQLPVAMVSEDFFSRFVSIFQELGEPLLEDADNVDHVADVSVAPAEVVRWLGSWIAVDDIDPSLPEDLQRKIVAGAATTLTWRGTAYGLVRYLELVTGGDVSIEDGGGVWRSGEAPTDPAWVVMRVASTGQLVEADFVEIVRDEVPAHVRAELYVGPRRVWSSQEDGHE